MAVLEIVKEGAPVLRKQAEPVTQVTKRIRRLVKDMLDTMYEANGVGLAAPQVGMSRGSVVVWGRVGCAHQSESRSSR